MSSAAEAMALPVDSLGDTQQFEAHYAAHSDDDEANEGDDAFDDDSLDDEDDDAFDGSSLTGGSSLSATARFQVESAAVAAGLRPPPPDTQREWEEYARRKATKQRREQHKGQGREGDMEERPAEEQEDEEKQHDPTGSLSASMQLNPQDYIPTRLVGYTYGSSADWQLKPSPHPLRDRESYARVGSTGIFECRPAEVRFEGFETGRVYRSTLSVVNVSQRAQRLHILPPDDPSAAGAFRIRVEKRGAIAPGMSQDIHVEFEPGAYRYFSDFVRLHAPGVNLLVPLHAYPALNKAGYVFPTHVDLGECRVGARVSRRFELRSDTPVQFEYELTLQGGGSDFRLFPTRGIIPPNGSAWVTLDYEPKRCVTHSCSIRVNLSQLGFKPYVASVVGHARVRDADPPPIVDRKAEAAKEAARARRQRALAASNDFARRQAERIEQKRSAAASATNSPARSRAHSPTPATTKLPAISRAK